MKSRAACAAIAIATSAIAGCGGGDPRDRARETTTTAAQALMEVERTSGGEEGVSEPLARSRDWLDQTEHAIELWPTSGSLAYETIAPCLGRSLGELRSAIVSAGGSVPTSLEQAEALALAAAERRCGSRR
jgi:hypothetical protein